jgi:hypothetical protein
MLIVMSNTFGIILTYHSIGARLVGMEATILFYIIFWISVSIFAVALIAIGKAMIKNASKNNENVMCYGCPYEEKGEVCPYIKECEGAIK